MEMMLQPCALPTQAWTLACRCSRELNGVGFDVVVPKTSVFVDGASSRIKNRNCQPWPIKEMCCKDSFAMNNGSTTPAAILPGKMEWCGIWNLNALERGDPIGPSSFHGTTVSHSLRSPLPFRRRYSRFIELQETTNLKTPLKGSPSMADTELDYWGPSLIAVSDIPS